MWRGDELTTYAELNRQRKQARALFLEIRALGLNLRIHEDAEDPTGYRLEVLGVRSLSPAHADRLERRVEAAKPGLIKVACSRWDADLEAIRKEISTA
jgi:hypothetical protein